MQELTSMEDFCQYRCSRGGLHRRDGRDGERGRAPSGLPICGRVELQGESHRQPWSEWSVLLVSYLFGGLRGTRRPPMLMSLAASQVRRHVSTFVSTRKRQRPGRLSWSGSALAGEQERSPERADMP